MTDIEIAVGSLKGHSICFCKNGEYFSKDDKGVLPILNLINENMNLSGYSVADIIVGKAVAILFVKAGIVCVYGSVMSKSGKDFLLANGIETRYDLLVENIVNRKGIDICPMEKTVEKINDVNEGYLKLKGSMSFYCEL